MYSDTMLGRILELKTLNFNINTMCLMGPRAYNVRIRKMILTSHFLKCHTRHRKKPQHGSRYLTNPDRIFEFNAWYVSILGHYV